MEKMLAKWLEKGLINKNQYLDLMYDCNLQKEKTKKLTQQVTMYIIGAILLGLGIFLFISANDWLLEFLNSHNCIKILLMFLLTISLFQGGYVLNKNNKFPRLGFSLIFLSCLSLGGLIALIGQIYNLHSNCWVLYLLWFLGIYPLSFVFKSNSVNILSCVIFILGTIFFFDARGFESEYILFIYIPFILGNLFYTLGNLIITKNEFSNFSKSYKNIGLFAIYIMLLVLTFSKGHEKEINNILLIIPIVGLFFINFINWIKEKNKTLLFNIEFYYTLALGLYILLTPYMNMITIELLANLFIIFLIASMYVFSSTKQSNATKFLTLYLIITFHRFGSQYLQGALFYIISGIILLSIGIYLEKNKKIKRIK